MSKGNMEYYKEYPIRCKSCNELISTYSRDYEGLLDSGSSKEEALNMLNIMEPCSRMAMANPTIVMYNMENREVIEGFKDVTASDEPDFLTIRTTNPSDPIFNACMGDLKSPIQTLKPSPTFKPVTPQTVTRKQPPSPSSFGKTRPGLVTLGIVQPTQRQQVIPVAKTSPSIIKPSVVAPIIDTENFTDFGKGMPVESLNASPFIEPTIPGIPTINDDPNLKMAVIFVGRDKQVNVLNGRTYLAQ